MFDLMCKDVIEAVRQSGGLEGAGDASFAHGVSQQEQ